MIAGACRRLKDARRHGLRHACSRGGRRLHARFFDDGCQCDEERERGHGRERSPFR